LLAYMLKSPAIASLILLSAGQHLNFSPHLGRRSQFKS
jgi:hypothetical protein